MAELNKRRRKIASQTSKNIKLKLAKEEMSYKLSKTDIEEPRKR